MVASETEIANLALSHLAVKPITSLDERSAEARTLTRHYAQARDKVLRDFPWAFATKSTALALVAMQPTDEWGYSYQLPTDCLAFRRILSGFVVDTTLTRVPYRLVRAPSGAGMLVYTNQGDAQAEWTFQETSVIVYPPDFVDALSFLLAFYAAPSITGGDQFKLGIRAYEAYLRAMTIARANALAEQAPSPVPDSEFISGR